MFHSLLFWTTTVLLVEILIANLLFQTWEGYIGEASKRKHIASEATAKAPSIWPRWRPCLDFSVHVGAKKPQHGTEGNIRFSTFCISDSSWAFALILFKGTYDLPFVNCGGRLSVLLFLDILEHLTQLVYSIIPIFSLHCIFPKFPQISSESIGFYFQLSTADSPSARSVQLSNFLFSALLMLFLVSLGILTLSHGFK